MYFQLLFCFISFVLRSLCLFYEFRGGIFFLSFAGFFFLSFVVFFFSLSRGFFYLSFLVLFSAYFCVVFFSSYLTLSCYLFSLRGLLSFIVFFFEYAFSHYKLHPSDHFVQFPSRRVPSFSLLPKCSVCKVSTSLYCCTSHIIGRPANQPVFASTKALSKVTLIKTPSNCLQTLLSNLMWYNFLPHSIITALPLILLQNTTG